MGEGSAGLGIIPKKNSFFTASLRALRCWTEDLWSIETWDKQSEGHLTEESWTELESSSQKEKKEGNK